MSACKNCNFTLREQLIYDLAMKHVEEVVNHMVLKDKDPTVIMGTISDFIVSYVDTIIDRMNKKKPEATTASKGRPDLLPPSGNGR